MLAGELSALQEEAANMPKKAAKKPEPKKKAEVYRIIFRVGNGARPKK